MTLDSRVVRVEVAALARVATEIVMLDAGARFYLTLNDVGAEVWDRIETPTTVRQICEDLAARFDVTSERCAADVLAFLADMELRSLIVVTP